MYKLIVKLAFEIGCVNMPQGRKLILYGDE